MRRGKKKSLEEKMHTALKEENLAPPRANPDLSKNMVFIEGTPQVIRDPIIVAAKAKALEAHHVATAYGDQPATVTLYCSDFDIISAEGQEKVLDTFTEDEELFKVPDLFEGIEISTQVRYTLRLTHTFTHHAEPYLLLHIRECPTTTLGFCFGDSKALLHARTSLRSPSSVRNVCWHLCVRM